MLELPCVKLVSVATDGVLAIKGKNIVIIIGLSNKGPNFQVYHLFTV